jgi:phosphoglucosamine mutase
MARLFGTDGIRGTANVEPMTPETAMALGRAAAQVLASSAPTAKPCVVVGRDTRQSGPMLEAAITAGLCSAGVNVLNVGVFPTPGVAYLTRAVGALAGVMISASHNPYMDNGIKFFSATGMKLDDHLEDAIEAHLQAPLTVTRPTGKLVGSPRAYADPVQRYIDFLKSTSCYATPGSLRIGLDCANGAASAVAPALFKQLGAQVYVWHATPDGININHQCGSLHPEFLQQKVRHEGLDLGFTFDGDADRLIAIDHTGGILDGDYILAICAQALSEADLLSPRMVVGTIMANLGLDHALRRQDIALHKTQVGDKHVLQAMRHHGAMLGGEQSGHVIFLNHHTTGDGLLTAVQVLNAVLARQTPLAELAQILRKCPQVLINVQLPERRDPLGLPQVQQTVQQAEAALGMDGRVLVRLSGTELVARVMVEGPDHAMIEPLAQRIAHAIASELGSS